MAIKQYICPYWPEYSLSGKVKFVGGWFTTDDPDLQKLIESNDQWHVRIWNAAGDDNGEEAKTEARADSEALREVGYDPEGGEGLSPLLEVEAVEAPRPGESVNGGGYDQGRETGDVLQEFKEVVRGSGITGSESKALPRKAGKR